MGPHAALECAASGAVGAVLDDASQGTRRLHWANSASYCGRCCGQCTMRLHTAAAAGRAAAGHTQLRIGDTRYCPRARPAPAQQRPLRSSATHTLRSRALADCWHPFPTSPSPTTERIHVAELHSNTFSLSSLTTLRLAASRRQPPPSLIQSSAAVACLARSIRIRRFAFLLPCGLQPLPSALSPPSARWCPCVRCECTVACAVSLFLCSPLRCAAMSKRSRDLGLQVGVRVACCGPPHPNRDSSKAAARQGGGGVGLEESHAPSAPVELYGVITREGSAANGGWFEVALDSAPDKKVYYRRGSICKLKPQQPHTSPRHQQQQQHADVAPVRALTQSAQSRPALPGTLLVAALATPATLLSAPSSPPSFVLQSHTAHSHLQQPAHLPSAAVLLSPTRAQCGEGSVSSVVFQWPTVTSPVSRSACTCSLGCAPLLPLAPLTLLHSTSARRASIGGVNGPELLAHATSTPATAAVSRGDAVCVELHSPPFATAARCTSTPSRPLLFNSAAACTSPSSLSSITLTPDAGHPSAFTSVASSGAISVVTPHAVRVCGSSTGASKQRPPPAASAPLTVAIPAARRATAALVRSATLPPAAALAAGADFRVAAVSAHPFAAPFTARTGAPSLCASRAASPLAVVELECATSALCFDVASKRRRLLLDDSGAEPSTLDGHLNLPAYSSAACLPAALVQPALFHAVALCSL